MSRFDDWAAGELRAIESKNLLRRLRVLDSPQAVSVRIDGRNLVNFSSNDYLGLAADPRIREAAVRAIDDYGAGAGASRLISGTQRPHQLLEERLAALKETQAALAFSTGYAAALGTIPAVVRDGDIVILDKLCHACLVDGARLSGATVRVFPHNNLDRLESHLRWSRERSPVGRVLVITESVFSMDGDTAHLKEIVELKERFDAWLLVDEAHAVGVIGARGCGLVQHLGLGGRVELQMGTLGKALGAAGGSICGSRPAIDLLINRARSFIFSTAPIPAAAAAAAESVRLLLSGEAEPLRQRLWENIGVAQRAAGVDNEWESAILPWIVGSEETALALASSLCEAGFLVPAIRYPTVPRGTARLRMTLSASHRQDEIEAVARALLKTPNRVCAPSASGIEGR